MSHHRFKIENLENLQELNAEEFSSIQGGYYSTNYEDINIDLDALGIKIELEAMEFGGVLIEAGGTMQTGAVVSASKYIVLAIPVPDGFIFNGSLTGGVM